MGCTGSKSKEPYPQLVSKYGLDKVKEFVVGTSNVQFIESNKKQIIGIIQKKVKSLKEELLNEIDNQKLTAQRKYQNSINKIQKVNIKAIPSAQKIHKIKIQQLMGYDQVMKKYKEFKDQCQTSLQRQQSLSITFWINFLSQLQQSQARKIPTLKKFQGLEDDEQAQILKLAKQKNKESIQKGLTSIQDSIEEKSNSYDFEAKFRNIVSKQKLRQLNLLAQRLYSEGQQKVKGASNCNTC